MTSLAEQMSETGRPSAEKRTVEDGSFVIMIAKAPSGPSGNHPRSYLTLFFFIHFYYSWNGGRAEAVCAGENE